MKIINRYIFRELGTVFLGSLAALTSVLIIIGLVKEAVQNHVPLAHVIQLVPYVVVEMSRISLPVTLLLAVTAFFAKMSGNNEITAMKSLGIPPKKILLPIWFISILISIFAVWVNEMAVTWGRTGAAMVIYKGAEDILLEQLKREHRFETGNKDITIMVRGVENKKLIHPTIILKKESATIEAETAEINIDFNQETMSVNLVDIKVIGEKGAFRMASQRRDVTIPLGEIISTSTQDSRPSVMALAAIPEKLEESQTSIESQRRTIAAHRIFASALGSPDNWNSAEVINAERIMTSLNTSMNRLNVEPYRRWATGFSCFCFVWLGAPLAVWMRKPDFFSSFFACFVPILLLYYPLLMFGLDQAKSGNLPPTVVWLANLGIFLAGFWFLKKIHRY
ncbi:MAG: LptF/LptG family permease [Planctomycetaceae bacterium]|jgi:lipopolysaccharide export system permease protein|nr:LptF/LptG family permease [Planctomycetaceae bacterium]